MGDTDREGGEVGSEPSHSSKDPYEYEKLY